MLVPREPGQPTGTVSAQEPVSVENRMGHLDKVPCCLSPCLVCLVGDPRVQVSYFETRLEEIILSTRRAGVGLCCTELPGRDSPP